MAQGQQIARWWMTVGGVLMIVMGLLAVMDTSVVGSSPHALLAMNAMHGEVHALGGLIAIAIGLGLSGRARANATIAYGLVFLVGFVINVMSPDLWGMMSVPANAGVHAMHLTVALVCLATGYLARSEVTAYRATAPQGR